MKGTMSKLPLWIAVAAAAVLMALLMNSAGQTDAASVQERRMAEVLSAMEGAGRVEVALFYAQSAGGFSAAESAVPTGALVVAEGAGDMAVRLSLIRAVRTLLGLPENAVDVFVMEGVE